MTHRKEYSLENNTKVAEVEEISRKQGLVVNYEQAI